MEGAGIFLFSETSIMSVGSTQPTVQWVLVELCPGVQQQGHEVDRSSTSSREVKNERSSASTPTPSPISHRGVQRDKFRSLGKG